MDKKEFKKFAGVAADYRTWKIRVQDALVTTDLWEIVNKTPEQSREAEFKVATRKSLAIIRSYVVDGQIDLVSSEDTIPVVFKKLDDKFAKSKSGPSSTWAEITKTTFTGATSIHSHVQIFDNFFRDLQEAGNPLSIPSKIDLLMQSMPRTFEDLRTYILTATSEVTYDMVKNWVIEKATRYENEKAIMPKALQIGKQVHKPRPHKFAKQRKSGDKLKLCNFCKRPGHVLKQCWKKYPSLRPAKTGTKPEASKKKQKQINLLTNSHEVNQSFVCMMMAEEAQYSQDEESYQFILDSGATEHIIKQENLAEEFTSLPNPCRINTAKSGEFVTAISSGTLKMVTNQGVELKMANVLYVPQAVHNIISVARLTAAGIEVIFGYSEVILRKGEIVIAKGQGVQIQLRRFAEECER